MSMSRKDYELIAKAIRNSKEDFRSVKSHATFAGFMAWNLSEDNPRFDKVKFIEACKPRWMVGAGNEGTWDRVAKGWAGER